jgi:hypothetical protein
MKQVLVILLLCLTICQASAQRISRSYQDMSLSEVLKDLNAASDRYEVNFIYDELEDFRVTTTLHRSTLPNAVRQVVGFYPMRVTETDSVITVECIHKTDLHLTGTIIDEQGQPVAYANIAVLNPADSTLLCGGVSNESGVFVIPIDQPNILARISYVGYKTIYKQCNNTELGTIRMHPETQMLKGVTVEGLMPVLRREAGKIIFDTRYIVGAINATDMLRYAPGVMLHDDDISLFGTTGIIFCINNKEQHIGQKEMLQILKSYPADDVEKIEIIQTPGSEYSVAGNAGIINLILKKKGNDYIGGSVGYAHTQYEEHGDEANANIIYNKGKVSTSLNVAGIWDNTRYKETNTIMFDNGQRDNIDNGHIRKNNYSARWQIDYDASEHLNIGAYAMISDGNRKLDIDGKYAKEGYIQGNDTSETRRHEDTRNYALNVYATQKLNDEGSRIDYSLDYYHMKMGDDRMSEALYNYTDDYLEEFIYQNTITQNVTSYSAKVDAKVGKFKFGSQYTFTRSKRDLTFSWAPDYEQWSNFVYDEQVLSAYAEYSGKLGNSLSFNLDGRYEQTWTKGHRLSKIDDATHHTQYGRFFPSLSIGYQHRDHSLNWSITSRITRPNIINVNPDTLCNDIYHSSWGNPDLKPTYLYKAMMGYTYKGMLSFDLYYAYEPNRMTQVSFISGMETSLSTWDNVVDQHILGINSSYYFDRLKWMNAILMQGVYWDRTVGNGQRTLPDVEGWSYTGILQTSFFFDRDRKWTANLNITYSSPEKDVTKALNARYMVDAGLQYRFWKDRMTLGLTCRNLLASRIKGTEYLGTTAMDFDNKFNYRQFRLTLTYNWGAKLRHDQRRYESDEMKERTKNDF